MDNYMKIMYHYTLGIVETLSWNGRNGLYL